MSKKLLVKEALWRKMNELPLPDENESWLKMKALLADKKERKPFVFFGKEMLAGGIMLLLFLGLWLMIAPKKMQQPTIIIKGINGVYKKEKIKEKNGQETASNHSSVNAIKDNSEDSFSNYLSSAQPRKNHEIVSSEVNHSGLKNRKELTAKKFFSARTNWSAKFNLLNKKQRKNYNQGSENENKKSDDSTVIAVHSFLNKNKATMQPSDSSKSLGDEDKNVYSSLAVNGKDSSMQEFPKDSLQQTKESNDEAISTTKKLITIKKYNSFFVDAGIELKQQLPVSNQRLLFYNYKGRQTPFPDYLPSVYMKLEKEKRWFVEGEFGYASPRLLKDFIYLQKTKVDYAHSNLTVTTYHLQKTYYTQVPVSFNLFIHSSWSVGAGAMYSWLRGAVTKQEVATGVAPSNLQSITEEMLPINGFTDSFLYKTQASLLLQAAYEKNKWSFGLRYLQDVQPFITYTLPDGMKNDKLNSSLELVIRYRLFRSNKFKIKTK